jgi:putative ABC transport system permease protein
VVGLCRHFGVRVERETAISIARGFVQMVFVGIVLAVLLHGSLLIGATILLAMTFAAAVTASRRAAFPTRCSCRSTQSRPGAAW